MANLQSENSNYHGIRYYLLQYWQENGDPRTNSLPLIREGPWPTFFVIGLYLLFVTRIGPSMMKKRDPFNLRTPMLIYNILMVVINFYFLIQSMKFVHKISNLFDYKFPDPKDPKIYTAEKLGNIWVGYLYWISKFIDLFDTVFFVLRKKYNQISVLHLYHHTSVPTLGWFLFWHRYCHSPLILFQFLNSGIHVIMYSYYALAALGPWIRPYLWWKRYLTMLQLIQFAILILYAIPLFIFSDYPLTSFWLATSQPILFILLFGKFYLKTYFEKQNKKIQ